MPAFFVFIHLCRISADQSVITHQQKRDLRAADGLRRIPDALLLGDEPVVPRPGHGIPAALRYFGRIGVVVERAGDCGLTSKTVEHDDRLLAGQKAARVKRPAVATHESLADHPLDIFIIPLVAREVAELCVLFELLGKTNDRTLITSAGSYLGGAFYQLYRALHRASGGKEGYFGLDATAYQSGAVDAQMRADYIAYASSLAQLSEKDGAFASMEDEALASLYPGLMQSVTQVLHSTEEKTNSLLGRK